MIRWGIAGPGRIAATFAEAMRVVDGGEVVAVASRAADRANAFGDRFAIANRYGDYASLAADPAVDVVYVATPHARHATDSVTYLEAGKHVLCEKPLALNASQVRIMIEAAQRTGVFLMEALWSRFLPPYIALKEIVASGRIGEPQLVDAEFGFRAPFNPDHRLFDPQQGGGSLLDLGIYPLQLCTLVLGPVDRALAVGVNGATGVDEVAAAVLQHRDGGVGVIKSSLRAGLASTARISGTEGAIAIPQFMHASQSLTVIANDGSREQIATPFEHGFRYQIEEVHRCLAAGRTESTVMPHATSLELAVVMDDIRRQLGVVYPGE